MNVDLMLNAFVVWTINQMRSSAHPLFAKVTAENPTVLRVLSACAAALTSIGVAWQFDGGTLTITGLTQENFARLLVSMLHNFIAQYGFFRLDGVLRSVVGKPVVDATPARSGE